MKNQPGAESLPRVTAAQILARWMKDGDFPDRMLDRVSRHHSAILEWVQGVVRWHRALRWLEDQRVDQRPGFHLESILLIGLYELFLGGQPSEYAVVDEAVRAAKQAGGQRSGNFVNAVLRGAARERVALAAGLEQQPAGIRWSHPDLLVERWEQQWETAAVRQLLQHNNTAPDVILCALQTRCALPDFVSRLAAAGITAPPHPFALHRSLVAPHGKRVPELPGYAEGWFIVQDPAAGMAVDLLDAQPGERVLDACAAPGGKTILLADAMRNQGTLVAADIHADRMDVLRQSVARYGVSIITTAKADARSPEDLGRLAGGREFDRILLDVPCSNTGVIRRRPDARWRFTSERLQALTGIQRAILTAAATVLKPGGRLVYSTCSLEPEENEVLVHEWLASHPEFRLETDRRLFPPDTGTDGAYAAALVRMPA